MSEIQTLIKGPSVTWTQTPSLPLVKYEINHLDMRFFSRPELPEALEQAAVMLEAEARRLRRRANAARDSIRNASKAAQEAGRARKLAKAILTAGAPLGAASAALQAEINMPRATAIQHVQIAARGLAIDTRAIRNETIMRLKREGFKNVEIARRLNMHTKSVARIAGQMRRATLSV